MGYLDEDKDSKGKNIFSVLISLYSYVYLETCGSFPKVAITAHFLTLTVKNHGYLGIIVMTEVGSHIRGAGWECQGSSGGGGGPRLSWFVGLLVCLTLG